MTSNLQKVSHHIWFVPFDCVFLILASSNVFYPVWLCVSAPNIFLYLILIIHQDQHFSPSQALLPPTSLLFALLSPDVSAFHLATQDLCPSAPCPASLLGEGEIIVLVVSGASTWGQWLVESENSALCLGKLDKNIQLDLQLWAATHLALRFKATRAGFSRAQLLYA